MKGISFTPWLARFGFCLVLALALTGPSGRATTLDPSNCGSARELNPERPSPFKRPPRNHDDILTESYIRRNVNDRLKEQKKQMTNEELLTHCNKLRDKLADALEAALNGEFEKADRLITEVKSEHLFEVIDKPYLMGDNKVRNFGSLLEAGARGQLSFWRVLQLETGSTTGTGGNGSDPIRGKIYYTVISPRDARGQPLTDAADPVVRGTRLKNVVTASEEMLHGLDDILQAYGQREGILRGTWAARNWDTYFGIAEANQESRGGVHLAMGEGAIGVMLLEANQRARTKMPDGFLDAFVTSYKVRKKLQEEMKPPDP